MHFNSKSEIETFNIGRKFSKNLKPGDIVLVEGTLGAGKSVFIRGVAKGLGINEPMPSPTFTILNEYEGKCKMYHFDLYRINSPEELYNIGFEEYLYSEAISLIEWPSKAGFLLPEKAIKVNIEITENGRIIKITWKK